MIDLHCHILPGLDDGPADMEEALLLCRAAAADGTRVVVATPHMLDGLYDVKREEVISGVKALRRRLQEEGIPLKVFPGADIRLDPDLPRLLAEGRLVTVGDLPLGTADGRSPYLMLELPEAVIPRGLSDLLFTLQVMGLTPMISHPERNFDVQSDPERVRPWVDAGTVLQLTAGSLVGAFGRRAERCARTLLRARLAHVVASDAHSTTGRPPGLSRARAVVERLLSPEEAEAIFVRRPQAILAGRL